MKSQAINPLFPDTLLHKMPDEQIQMITQQFLQEKSTLSQVVAALIDTLPGKINVFHYNCFRILIKIADAQPDLLFPYWDHFIKLWKNELPDHRVMGVQLFARVVSADKDSRTDSVFGEYMKILDDPNLIPSRMFVQTLIHIIHSKPHLQPQILSALFNFNQTHHKIPNQALIWSDIIELFGQIYPTVPDNDKSIIQQLIQQHLSSTSPKTRQVAKKVQQIVMDR